LVAVAVAASVGLLPSLGQGPLYSLSEAEGDACAAGGWWVDLLYIQNLVNLHDAQSKLGGCERHFWYLANDMQFYLVAPLFVFPFVLSYRLGWAVLGLLLAGSTAANAAIAAINHYAASPLFDMTYFTRLYIQPWTRAQPFLVGVGFAALWAQLQQRATRRLAAGLLESSGGPAHGPAGRANGGGRKGPPVGVADPPGLSFGLCGFAAVVMIATVFGTHGLYQELPSRWTDAQNVSFIVLSRLGWALALSAIAYVCFTRQAPLTNALLSWWPMQIWGKLAFGAYVSHPLLMTALYYSETRLIAYTDAWYARAFTTNLVWSSAVALFLWLLVEKPAANLLALALVRIGVKG
jgi:peptidoglycan/LPS O-acetylase OafA/YrhL